MEVRPGEKGPLVVEAVEAPRVQTKDEQGRIGPVERLVVIRNRAESKTWYTLSNAAAEAPLSELVYAHGERHRVEEMFQEGNGEVGLDHYEVRNWEGWHHHMVLSLLTLWFLVLERRRVGEKKTGADGAADARSSRGCCGTRRPAPSRSSRRSTACCGVTRKPASTTGTNGPATSPRAATRRTQRGGLQMKKGYSRTSAASLKQPITKTGNGVSCLVPRL